MRTTRIAALVSGALLITAALGIAQTASDPTLKDIQQTLGFVPGFFKAFPEHGLAGAWEEMKTVQMNPKSALPGKTKELFGLAVAAQIPCRYCIYFHTSVAKANGATEQEVKEALAVSALVRHWSTVLNGNQIDFARFKDEVNRMFQNAGQKKQGGAAAPASPPAEITDAVSAYADIEQTIGFVPTFMKMFPEEGIAGAWREMKSLELSPDTALDLKTKALVGLGVSAQVPCQYCVYHDTEMARHAGASDSEIREAIAIAAITRHWSTVLNGSLLDENAFKRDVDRLVRTMTEKAPKAAQK